MVFYIYDSSFNKLAIIDSYESAIWTDRYLEPGDFELYIKIKDTIPSKIAIGRYLSHKDSEHTMIIEKLQIETDVEDGNKLIVTGRSMESILDRRIVWKKTIFDAGTSLQTAIKKLITDNIISPSISDRKISNFVFSTSTDSKITSLALEGEYMGENLLDIITKICDTNKIGFKIIVDYDTKELKFSLYAGKDRTSIQSANSYVVFSPKMDNLLNSNYQDDMTPHKNIAYCVGPEEDVYDKVYPTGDENPHEEGWYKYVDNEYVLTEDTKVFPAPLVQYYRKDEKEKRRISQVAGSGKGLARREIYNDCSSASRQGDVTYDPIDAGDMQRKSPKEEGWYRKVDGEYMKAQEPYAEPGVQYYEKNTHTKDDAEFKKLLLQMGKEKLSENKRKEEIDGEISYNTGVFKYRKHYKIGDVVQIINEYGFKGKKRVTEFIFSDNVSDGLVCHPTFEMVEED